MKILFAILIAAASFLLLSCATEDSTPTAAGKAYVVFAWNDLGMHCLNPTYDTAVLLPPYNTVWAQVIKRGNPPQVVTAGISLEYRIVNNTASYTKTYGDSKFGQFWDNCLALFGVSLAHDKGLNLEDPLVHNGLSGAMVGKYRPFSSKRDPRDAGGRCREMEPLPGCRNHGKGRGGEDPCADEGDGSDVRRDKLLPLPRRSERHGDLHQHIDLPRCRP